jgi:hypothetical protein
MIDSSRTIVDLEQVTNTCFVVMPFHSLFDSEYERVIRPAIKDTGLECVKGNEVYTEQDIVQDIWRSRDKTKGAASTDARAFGEV